MVVSERAGYLLFTRRASLRAADATKLLMLIPCDFAARSTSSCSCSV
jgi:hypothetical protein